MRISQFAHCDIIEVDGRKLRGGRDVTHRIPKEKKSAAAFRIAKDRRVNHRACTKPVLIARCYR